MDKICAHGCEALHFRSEPARLKHSCCHRGKSLAPPLTPYPDGLRDLLTGVTKESEYFRDDIRKYNSAHAFASFGAKIERLRGRGTYCFRISGQVYHDATSALVRDPPPDPNRPDQPKYGQIYVFDTDAATERRMLVPQNAGCTAEIMRRIDQELRQINPYVAEYRLSSVSPRQSEAFHLRLLLLNVPGATSFEYLRTVDGVVCDTYRAACLARGLMIDDREWRRCTAAPIHDAEGIMIIIRPASHPLRRHGSK